MVSDGQETLKQCRERIDDIDARILELLNERAREALAIGVVKRAQGMPIHVPEREESVIRRIADMNTGPLSESAIEAVFREIFAGMRALEEEGDQQ